MLREICKEKDASTQYKSKNKHNLKTKNTLWIFLGVLSHCHNFPQAVTVLKDTVSILKSPYTKEWGVKGSFNMAFI